MRLWRRRMGDTRPEKIPALVPAQAPRLPRLLEQARQNDADLVIIDTPGNAPELGDAVAHEADAILIPCRPDGLDLISIAVSVKRMQAQGTETAEPIAIIRAAGVEVCPVVLQQREVAGQIRTGR